MDVSIICITYNHEKYIRKAIEGFLMQKVNFDYEIIIHDDFSTDNTTKIIKEYKKEYPDKITLILQSENQYSKDVKIAETYIYPIVKGKYVAFCDGDDYWIYEGKLQEQYELMESHPEISACYHNALIYSQRKDLIQLNVLNQPSGYISDEDIICVTNGWYPTSSLVARTELIKMQSVSKSPTGDEGMRNYLACMGKMYFINRAWSIYREFSDGGWNTQYYKDKELATAHFKKTILYFQEFNKYSGGRFDSYIKRRLFSGVDKYRGAHYGKIKDCSIGELQKCINELKNNSNHIADNVLDEYYAVNVIKCKNYYKSVIELYFNSYDEIYLYGAGTEAVKALIELDRYHMKPKGFIVSNKYNFSKELLEIPIYEISEIVFDKNKKIWPCLINGREEVLKILEDRGCKSIVVL